MTAAAALLAFTMAPWSYPVDLVAMSWEPIIYRHADAYLVPRPLAMRVAFVESSFRAHAVSSDARGLYQVSVRYEAEHAAKAGVKGYDWRKPGDSARVGLALLARLHTRYNDWPLAVAAYNCGPTRLESASPLPTETVEYLRRVFR